MLVIWVLRDSYPSIHSLLPLLFAKLWGLLLPQWSHLGHLGLFLGLVLWSIFRFSLCYTELLDTLYLHVLQNNHQPWLSSMPKILVPRTHSPNWAPELSPPSCVKREFDHLYFVFLWKDFLFSMEKMIGQIVYLNDCHMTHAALKCNYSY